jgi:hypothetical protein
MIIKPYQLIAEMLPAIHLHLTLGNELRHPYT